MITGLDSAQARAEESERIVNWAFRQFAQRDIAGTGTVIADAEVWMGESATVGLALKDDLSMLVPTTGGTTLGADVIYNGPVEAPITAGQEIAELVIRLDNLPETRVPLVAASDVARGGFQTSLRVAADVLMTRFLADDTAPEQTE